MDYHIMEERDIERVVLLYIDYYNHYEESCWTHQTSYKRIHQIWSMEDSYCLVLEDDGKLVGFAVGCFRQYDDLVAYDLDEIVVDAAYQKRGIGTSFLLELERRVKEQGAAMIELKAVNDEMHEHFYGKLDYQKVGNFTLKTKWFE